MSAEMGEFGQDTYSTTNTTQSESMPPSSTHDGTRSRCVCSKLKRKAPMPRSEAWECFTKFVNEQGEPKARCNYTNKELFASDDPNQAELVFRHGGDGSLGNWKFNQDAIRKGLAEMIILDELPFKFVDGRGFRQMMSHACPKFRLPSRWTVARDSYQIYVDEKTKMKQFLKEYCVRVSLTTEIWTSLQRVNYLCLTAHFIDNNWKLNKKILNFCPVSSHRGEATGKVIEKCLRDWGIDRVFTVTVDNASSNDVAISYLKKRFNHLGICIQEGKFLHLRCITHILNLIVTEGLQEMNESIARVRGAVRYVRQSFARLAKFKECAEFEKIESKSLLCLDVSTRWDTTYLMLDTAQKYEKAFEAYDDIDPYYKSELMMGDGLPEEKDWENVRRFCLFFQKFYELTIKVSSSSYVTSNNFLDEICDVYITLRNWETHSDVELKAMAKRMKGKFDKYWGNAEKMNMLLYVAAVLDPRKKLEFVRFCFLEMYSLDRVSIMVDNVKKAFEELFEEYKKISQAQRDQVGESSQVSQVNDERDVLWSKFIMYKEEIGREENKTELDRFLSAEYAKDDVDFDVLIWWKLNGHRFPILSNMARDVLAVPLSTVTSKSAFSTSGCVLDAYRSSLTPRLVQALICAQDWLRGSSQFDDNEDLAELDKVDLDLSKIALDASID